MNKHYGLRLQVTGLSGYYTLLNQSQNHFSNESMPKPDDSVTEASYQQERNGYRKNAGTSIAIRLNPGELGTLNLKSTVEKYLCGSRMPVYYNNERIGQTYEEIMDAAHAVEGEKVYELTDEMKKQFDQVFPEVCGQYPKIAMTTIPLDTKEEDDVLQGVSGVLVKYILQFRKTPCWRVKDLTYQIGGYVEKKDNSLQMLLYSRCMESRMSHVYSWKSLRESYETKAVEALIDVFEKCDACPSEEQLGETWSPFQSSISVFEIWESYHDYIQCRQMNVLLEKCGCPDIIWQKSGFRDELIKCAYQGVYVGKMTEIHHPNYSCMGIFFLEDKWQPVTQASRVRIVQLPIEVGLYICGVVNKYKMPNLMQGPYVWMGSVINFTRKDWKKVENLPLQQWMESSMKDYFDERVDFLKEADLSKKYTANVYTRNNDGGMALMNLYQDLCLQEHNQMEINYEKGQSILLFEKEKNESDEILDLFPPMRFCKAANDKSRRYLCSAEPNDRKGITLDHPFMIWLMKNAILMNKYYQRQFRQIIDCLRFKLARDTISEINAIRQQLISLPEHHGVDVYNFPQLSRDDFWYMQDDERSI